ncbi:MAG: aspartate/glutamate/uridylate kinase [Planctomycetota bacterium]|nr:aspartate/glutamate/uridylate kinase [Planctomycetota bacterium]
MTGAGPIVVAKVGGSLLDWPELPGRLGRFVASRRDRGDRLVLIVGGGRAADWVRELDRIHAIGEAKSHALAIRSLDLTARVLAALVPGLAVAETIAEIAPLRLSGLVPILAPRVVLDEDDRASPDPLPHVWDVTTDSIAARLAVRLGARRLVLLKSARASPGTTRDQAARLGLVDPAFPVASRALSEVVAINLRDENLDDGVVLTVASPDSTITVPADHDDFEHVNALSP